MLVRCPAVLKKQATSNQALARIAYSVLNAEIQIDQEKEHVWAVGLDTKLKVKYVELVTLGTLDASLVHPREVFRLAVMKACSAIALIHNHPTGDTTPSFQDLEVTKRIVKAGNVLGIKLLDHVIIGAANDPDSNYCSMYEYCGSAFGS